MGYLMELSVNLRKTQNISNVKSELYKKAEECKVLDYYSMYEFVGENRQIHRNHCILYVVIGFLINRSLIAVELNAGSTIWWSLMMNTRVKLLYTPQTLWQICNLQEKLYSKCAGPTYPFLYRA